VTSYDPWVDPDRVERELALRPVSEPLPGHYDAVVVCVAHRQFADMGIEAIRRWCKPIHVLFDAKGLFPRDAVDGRI
jgi:UDP-N-acetyl-D-galactosamine dehydrogenase